MTHFQTGTLITERFNGTAVSPGKMSSLGPDWCCQHQAPWIAGQAPGSSRRKRLGWEVKPKGPGAAPTGVPKGAELISLTAAEMQHPAFHSEFYHWVTRS